MFKNEMESPMFEKSKMNKIDFEELRMLQRILTYFVEKQIFNG